MARNEGAVWLKWLIVIGVIALLGGGVWYWQHPHDPPPEYRTATVTRGDLTQAVTATGQLNPVVNVQVGSQVSGIISKLCVDFNSRVTNGQVVAQLDPATFKATRDQAEGDLENAKAVLELSQVETKRAEELHKAQLISQSDYDKAQADLHQAQASVMIKTAALERAQVDLNRSTIYAPIDGVVISRNVDVGQTVAASLSAPVLFVIANDLAKMQIDAAVSEADVGNIEVGQPVNFTVDAFPYRTFKGSVVQVRNAATTNQNVVTYDTVVGVDNEDQKLKPGMTANVSIITSQRDNVLKVPNGALRFRPAEAVVAEVKKAASNGASTTNLAAQAGSPVPAEGGGGQSVPGGTRGQGGRRQGGGGGGRTHAEHPSPTRTVYLPVPKSADNSTQVVTKPVQIKVGISDGISTEVLDGLKEGDLVIVGQNNAASPAQPATANPFGGGGRRF